MKTVKARIGLIDTLSAIGSRDGPHLLVLGAVHGNEPCGSAALYRIIRRIEARDLVADRGRVTLVPICNPEAYTSGRRYEARDLNRAFGPVANPVSPVDHHTNALCSLMRESDVLLDLHSFRSAGEAFLFLGPENNSDAPEPFSYANDELAFAQSLGVSTMVYGWLTAFRELAESQAAFLSLPENHYLHVERLRPDSGRGTTEYFRMMGRGYAVTLECGNHSDPVSVEVAENAVLRALRYLEIVDGPPIAPQRFKRTFFFKRIYIREDANDYVATDFTQFAAIANGSLLAVRADGGEVRAPSNGAVVFKYPNAHVGQQWIYFAGTSTRGT
jgi:predicted deacylase